MGAYPPLRQTNPGLAETNRTGHPKRLQRADDVASEISLPSQMPSGSIRTSFSYPYPPLGSKRLESSHRMAKGHSCPGSQTRQARDHQKQKVQLELDSSTLKRLT